MNILVAIDGSDAALQACRLVAGYAGDRSTLRITLLNVQRPPIHFLPPAGLEQPVLEKALRDEGSRQLEAARSLFQPGWAELETVVRLGPPAQTILAEARDRAAAVLVLGSGRHGLLGGYRMGSVALRIAPAARCTVVLVRADAKLPSALGKTLRVTAPVDGSPQSLQAVERLAASAALLGAMHVDLVHLQPGLSLAETVMPPHDDVVNEWSALQSDDALAQAAQVLSAAQIPHELHRATGAPESGIATFAREHAADLIAMGTRGHGAMHHLLMGSVALRTAHDSEIPVAFMR
jgi:nucleotide-binding universal stress UspA family protein